MAILFYNRAAVPNSAACYRPTVLDADWHPAAGAFRPNLAPAPPGHGWTQHLSTGDHGVPEVIHETLAANQIDSFVIRGPCVDDPADNYRNLR